MNIYKVLIRPGLFKIDPEIVHHKITNLGMFLGSHWISRKLVEIIYSYEDKMLENEILGIIFKNPIGIAGGFDKNALLTDILPCVGFGFIEVGSITAQKCEGNPKPRLWRLPKDHSIAVYYGLCNDGAEIIAKRLKNKNFKVPLGINIAKTNDPLINGKHSIEDYYKGFNLMKDIGDFITINISCPNTGDGCSFENPLMLDSLLKKINNKDKVIFLKIGVDLNEKQVDEIIKVVDKHKIHGFIIGNLTKKYDILNLKSNKEKLKNIKGGLSGNPVRKQSNELIKYVYKKTKGKYIIIGVGGVFSAEDAYEKIKNGASLVQLITGMIYHGPSIIKKINKGLVRLLKKEGYKNIKEAIGKNTVKF